MPGPSGIKQFQKFSLLTTAHPVVPDEHRDPEGWEIAQAPGFHAVIGPSLDPAAMEEAVRTLVPDEFGWPEVDRTTSPYR